MKDPLEVHVGEQSLRAFEELLAANLDALYRTALRLCDGRSADAEDLLQDAMLRAFEKRASLRDPSAGRAWLFTTLIRTNLNRVRSSRRRAETLATDFDDRGSSRLRFPPGRMKILLTSGWIVSSHEIRYGTPCRRSTPNSGQW
jgi:RNA polymerase sigma factor (sigma-70 family)